HVTFFINSLAHFWGRQPYTTRNTARDNDVLAFLTYGEGYHNYHHLFQYDYRNGIRWWHYDPTKWLIAACSWVGLTTDLKRVPDFKIQRAMLQAQFERAREKLAQKANANTGRVAELQHLLEQEWQHFSQTVAEWSRLQGEKLEAAKQQFSERVHERMHEAQNQWEHSEMRQKLLAMEQALEEALEMQRQRVKLLRVQMAYA
ncbi:MAG: acyl-CoA desaturase, partial [Nevskiaceae bacterium]